MKLRMKKKECIQIIKFLNLLKMDISLVLAACRQLIAKEEPYAYL